MTPVSTRAFLLVLERIKNNVELEAKPPSTIKSKEAAGKCKMESMDSCIPKKPKQVGFSDKQCTLCKKHGGPYKLHNTHDCRRVNPDNTPIKRNGGVGSAQKNGQADKHHSKERECKGTNFVQIIHKEVQKAFCKQSNKCKKHCTNDSKSDSDSGYSS